MAANLRAALANCPVVGEEATYLDDGSWVRNKISLRLSGFRVELLQDRNALDSWQRLINKAVYTTDLVFMEVSEKRAKAAISVATDISWLLALATNSQVQLVGYEHGKSKVSWPTRGVLMRFKPAIDINSGAAVREFIELAWPAYRKFKRSRRLSAVIDYVTMSEVSSQVTETKFLLSFVALESLKATFATSRRIPFVKGRFRKVTQGKGAGAPYSAEELLSLMLRSVGMRRGLKRVIDLRNEIVHAGFSRKSYQRLGDSYESCQGIIREYLLRLLSFRGAYLDYSERTWKVLQ